MIDYFLCVYIYIYSSWYLESVLVVVYEVLY